MITNYVIGNSDIELADMVDTELINIMVPQSRPLMKKLS